MHELSTTLIHHPYQPPDGFDAPQPGIFKASTVYFPNVAAMRQFEWKDKSAYTYGLHGTPTTYTLEERLCTLEGARQCLLVPSGLAAIATVSLALLASGDEVLLPDNAYGPSKALAEAELRLWGITHRYFDPMDPSDLAAKISPRTKLVWLEAAGSVTLEFPDLCKQVQICRRAGVRCALDNTWGAGLAFKPFDLQPGVTSMCRYTPSPSIPVAVVMCSWAASARLTASCTCRSNCVTCVWVWGWVPMTQKPYSGHCPACPCATVPMTKARVLWLVGVWVVQSLPRCCTRHFLNLPAMRTGERCAERQLVALPVCSA